jgi:hypothetical protein
MQFTTKNSPQTDPDISYANKLISKAYDTKCLGIFVHSTRSWEIHFDQITHKLSTSCYTIRSAKPFMSQESLKIVYCACFHCIMNYGLIFWGSSSNSAKICKTQHNVIRIITGCRRIDLHRDLFKNLKILLLQSQHMLSLLLSVVNKKNKFTVNSDVHHINTVEKRNFHQPSWNVGLYKK